MKVSTWLQIGFTRVWAKLLIIIRLEWQLPVMTQCYYQIWIRKELREQIKLTLKLTNQQENELPSLILTGTL